MGSGVNCGPRVLVGIYFVKAFYEKEIYSPYDFMGNRLGIGAKRLATIIFQIGGILGQSVRVLVAALALKVVTPLEFEHCIWIIGLFAVGWTWMGGMRTVIWTDVMQFFLFVGAGLFSLGWIISHLDGGWTQMVDTAGEAGKFTLLNLTTDPAVGFTLWVAIIAVPFQNLSAFGVDQLNAQRMFCCRDASDARKAMIASSAALLLTTLMLFVGTALYAYYEPMRMAGTEPAIFCRGWKLCVPGLDSDGTARGTARIDPRGNLCRGHIQPGFHPRCPFPNHPFFNSGREECGQRRRGQRSFSFPSARIDLGNFAGRICGGA